MIVRQLHVFFLIRHLPRPEVWSLRDELSAAEESYSLIHCFQVDEVVRVAHILLLSTRKIALVDISGASTGLSWRRFGFAIAEVERCSATRDFLRSGCRFRMAIVAADGGACEPCENVDTRGRALSIVGLFPLEGELVIFIAFDPSICRCDILSCVSIQRGVLAEFCRKPMWRNVSRAG